MEAVCQAAGISLPELFAGAITEPRILETYDYRDEQGVILYQVVRYEPTGFRQRRPDGNGGWTWNLNDTRRVLFNLPGILESDSVVVCEGEKDCHTAGKLGLVATCNPAAAGTLMANCQPRPCRSESR